MGVGGVIVLLVGTILTWVGIFFGVRWLMRRTKSYHETIGHIADPQEREGFRFAFNRLTQRTGPSDSNQVIEYVEYTVRLPGPFADLSISDAEARSLRASVAPTVDIPVFSAPETEDDAFDGIFDYATPPGPAVKKAMQNHRARQMLLNARRIFDRGVWVDNGVLRVVELGRPGPDDIDITLEFLTGELVQLRELFGGAGPTDGTVLDVGQSAIQSGAEAEPVESQAGGDWT